MSKNDLLKLIDRAYGMGQLSLFEWFDLKDKYEMPEKETDSYYRTCLYPLFGKRSHHLGKIELWYAYKCMMKGWDKAIESFRLSIEKREEKERMAKVKEGMIERFMAW